MIKNIQKKHKGFTLIEVVVMTGIISIIIISIFNLLNYSLELSKEKSRQEDALALANEDMEYLRSIPYNTLGTSTTACEPNPSDCILSASKPVSRNSVTYTLSRTIKYVYDVFDNVAITCTIALEDCTYLTYTFCNSGFCEDASGNPDPSGIDITGAKDYKKVTINVQWPSNTGAPMSITSNFSPDGIEPNCSSTGRGFLEIKVIDATAQPVQNASVYIDNTSITSALLPINDQTDSQGIFRVGCLEPDNDNNYEITINKLGASYDDIYSTDKTCPKGIGDGSENICPTLSPFNDIPTNNHANIINDTITYKTFGIDKLSTLKIKTVTQDLPDEWTVNSNTGIQDMLTVATGPSDSYYFFWRDDFTGQTRIFGQKYDSTKAPKWNSESDKQITSSNNQVLPHTTINATGDAFLAWNDDSSGNQDVYLKKLDSIDGTDLWTTGSDKLTIESSNQGKNQFNPKINIENNNKFFYLTFLDDRDDVSDIYTVRKNANDTTATSLYCDENNNSCSTEGNTCGAFGTCIKWTSPELKINDDSSGFTQEAISTAIEPTTDDLYIVWSDDRNSNKDIYAQKINPDGTFDTTWNANIKINETNGYEQSNPSIAISDESGTKYLYIVWQDFRNNNDFDIFMTKLDTNGNKMWTNDIEITTLDSDQTKPSITINTVSDAIYVAWEDKRNDTSNPDIYLQKYNIPIIPAENGVAQWTNDMMINHDTTVNSKQLSPQLAINSSGEVVITWKDDDAGDFDIRTATFSNPTTTPKSGVGLRVYGIKTIGLDTLAQNIYKFDKIFTTDTNGEINFDGLVGNENKLEWDNYNIVINGTGNSILRSDPPRIPTFNIPPDSARNITLTVGAATAQSTDFEIDITGAKLSSNKKHLKTISLKNNSSTRKLKITKIKVIWTKIGASATLHEIKIGDTEVWNQNAGSGDVLTITPFELDENTSYELDIEFINGDNMSDFTFSIIITLEGETDTVSATNFYPIQN